MNKSPLIFVSHHHSDSARLTTLKTRLEYFGFECFLAHKDIDASQKWRNIILKKLISCDIFIPFISESFKTSKWCDQESGIAFQLNKLIIPISNPCKPYGFLDETQALQFPKEYLFFEHEIIKIIDQYSPLNLRTIIINTLPSSKSFDQSNTLITHILNNYRSLTDSELNIISRAIMTNDQIFKANKTKNLIDKLLKYHESYFNQLSIDHLIKIRNNI